MNETQVEPQPGDEYTGRRTNDKYVVVGAVERWVILLAASRPAEGTFPVTLDRLRQEFAPVPKPLITEPTTIHIYPDHRASTFVNSTIAIGAVHLDGKGGYTEERF